VSLKPPSRAEPVTELRHIPIRESGEPLVDLLRFKPSLRWDNPRFKYRRETYARLSLAEKLAQADAALPAGYRLALIECWRAPTIQRRMYKAVWKRFQETNPDWSESKLRRVVNQFTAPMDLKVPPPHTTGGAVDLTLIGPDGEPCDMQSPFEIFDPIGFFFDAKGLSDAARRHREIIRAALTSTGITNYPSEYWHWSYGDQGWAYRGGHQHALYGPATPEGWQVAPEDDIEEALELV
jgi:D-alanyl-D-alanine dipeptidase